MMKNVSVHHQMICFQISVYITKVLKGKKLQLPA